MLNGNCDIQVQSVYDFRWRNKHRVNAVLAEWSNEFSDLWSVKKHARVADLQYMAGTLQERMDELIEDAERATEVMRQVDSDAAPVRVPLREWRACVRDKAKLEHQIAEEMGQLAAHIGQLAPADHVSMGARMELLGLRPRQALKEHQALGHGPQARQPNDFPVHIEQSEQEHAERVAEIQARYARRSSLPSPSELVERLMREYDGPEGPVDFMTGEPVPVEDVPAGEDSPDDEISEKDVEAVDVVRVVPPGIGDEPENVPDIPVEIEAVDPEIPAVAPEVERAARHLAEQVWGMGVLPHAELYSGVSAHWVDQYLALRFCGEHELADFRH